MVDGKVPGEMGEAESSGAVLFAVAENLEIAREFDGRLGPESPDVDFALLKARYGRKAGTNVRDMLRDVNIAHRVQIRNSRPRPSRDCPAGCRRPLRGSVRQTWIRACPAPIPRRCPCRPMRPSHSRAPLPGYKRSRLRGSA